MVKKEHRIREKGDSGRCKKQRSEKMYSKKRIRPNKNKKPAPKVIADDVDIEQQNQIEHIDIEIENVSAPQTVSSSRMEDIEMNKNERESIRRFRLIEMSIFSKVLSSLACLNCYNTSSLKLIDVADKKKKLYSYLKVYCDDCAFVHKFCTSPVVTRNNYICRGKNTMLEINARAVYGIRSIGIGFSLLSKLCGFPNMPPPMTQTSCNNMSNIIKAASKSVAEKSISDPAACLRKGEKTADIGVSVDGTWQQKGFSSTLVVVTAISIDTGKAFDVSILSKSCTGCTSMPKISKSNPKLYEAYFKTWATPLVYLLVYPYIVVFGQVSETF